MKVSNFYAMRALKKHGDLLELKEVDFSYLPVSNLTGGDAVGAPAAPSLNFKLHYGRSDGYRGKSW